MLWRRCLSSAKRRRKIKKNEIMPTVLRLPTTMKDAKMRHMKRVRKAWFDKSGHAFSRALRFVLENDIEFELIQKDYEVLLHNCRMLGSPDDLQEVLSRVERNENVSVNARMVRDAIAASGRVKLPIVGFSALSMIDKSERDVVMYNGLLQLAWKSEMRSWTESVLETMRRHDIMSDVFTYVLQ